MYDAHLKGEAASKAASGVAETFTEKKKLLQEYHDALMDKNEMKKAKQARTIAVDEKNSAGGKALRQAAMEGMDSEAVEQKPDSKQAKVTLNSIYEAMQEAKTIENDLKKRELDIREAEVQLHNELKRKRIEVDMKNAENQVSSIRPSSAVVI